MYQAELPVRFTVCGSSVKTCRVLILATSLKESRSLAALATPLLIGCPPVFKFGYTFRHKRG